ncbi:hypothetical protein E4U41_002896 [Claviceps citrina]|nr:hypothetical protein E4U41_002896 [Claviceps citrina]
MPLPPTRSLSDGTSTTGGLAKGLCVALALFISPGAFSMRKRIAPWLGRPQPEPEPVTAAPSLPPPPPLQCNDTLTLEALALLPAPSHHRVLDVDASESDAHSNRRNVGTRPGELFEKRPKPRRSVYFSPARWKQYLSRGTVSPAPFIHSSYCSHRDRREERWLTTPSQQQQQQQQTGPSLSSVPSVRSGGPGSGWASKTIVVSGAAALPPICEMKGTKAAEGDSSSEEPKKRHFQA